MNVRAAVLITWLLVAGCNYTHLKGSFAAGGNSRFSLPSGERGQLSYAFVAEQVFSKCVSCHGSSGGVNLESYSQITNNLNGIRRTVFETHSMPKRGSLSDAELSILWTWIEIGAPEQAPGGGTGPKPEPLKPAFDSIYSNIFKLKCITCHSAGNPGQRILLDKENLVNSPLELVLPGNADESGLVIAVERQDGKRMPPAKEGFAELRDDEKQAIRDWIQNGAVD